MSKNNKNKNTAVANAPAPANAAPIETAAAPVAETPTAETPAKPEAAPVIPFVLADQEDLTVVEAFIGVITSDEGKKDYKSLYQRYKNMITGFTDWKLITEKKYNNLRKLVSEFEAMPPIVKTAPVAAPTTEAAKAEVKAEEALGEVAAEAAAEPVAESTEEVKA